MALPTIYHYDAITGILLGQGLADQSPLDSPGTWLVPAYATDIEPPVPPAGKRPAFVDGAWQLVDSGVPAQTPTDEQITAAPTDLFGGPTIAEVFNVNPAGH